MFRAEANGKDLLFDTDGLAGGNEVFKDRETGSHWQQSSLMATSGPLKGTHLQLYPFLLTTWGEWQKQNPHTLVLKPLPGYADRLGAMNKMLKLGLSGTGAAPKGAFGHDNRLAPREMIVGLEVGDESKAYSFSSLEKVRVVNDEVGGKPVLIVQQPKSNTTTAFIARVGEMNLKFTALDPQVQKLIDSQTHSEWNDYGLCVAGKYKGTHLKPVILEPEYWFAWSEFHPKSGLYSPGVAR